MLSGATASGARNVTLMTLVLSSYVTMTVEQRTARLTILVDPRKKSTFTRLCAEEDATPSQVVRRLIRRYIEERTGQVWSPVEQPDTPMRRKDSTRPRRAAPR